MIADGVLRSVRHDGRDLRGTPGSPYLRPFLAFAFGLLFFAAFLAGFFAAFLFVAAFAFAIPVPPRA